VVLFGRFATGFSPSVCLLFIGQDFGFQGPSVLAEPRKSAGFSLAWSGSPAAALYYRNPCPYRGDGTAVLHPNQPEFRFAIHLVEKLGILVGGPSSM
jgi:hypothetical protein